MSYRILAALVAGLSLTVAGYIFGLHVASGEQAKRDLAASEAQRQQAVAYAGEILRRQATADGLAADLESARSAQASNNRIIYRDVIRYETLTPAAARVVLDGRWRLLHDAAATGTPTDAAGLATGAADPVEDASAIEVVSDNYEACRGWRAALIGWQEWWEMFKR
ncbi:hypothetical protein OTERR_13260 [Oryzomicrobium terrae]|uniref:Uncharacterized protein n=1 Tax=Oryzomicrobium terrae TaxID=1735038 RepID=A0A5C1E781_9RHOO|nr:hypothetical protein [Oryzomicrobium terrae]QEL64802.1 hypothetical protein OTERR_13260 [Oryzomicrobium terrae]